MIHGARLWIPFAVFHVMFGLVVFNVTRFYYINDNVKVSAEPTSTRQPTMIQDKGVSDIIQYLNSSNTTPTAIKNPAELSRQADQAFNDKQFSNALAYYEQLLALDPNNVGTYNNLGITLHYLGRSTEALEKLNKGAAIDPTFQRIWLTLGFVNSQTGNIKEARTTLSTAVQMDAENEVGQSAKQMLENLP
jgi:tetratricopeptide (TPR) repeat protein